MTAKVTFTARKFETATVAFLAAANAIDATIANSAKALNTWATLAAVGCETGKTTLDAIAADLMARCKADTVKKCGSTIAGRYYAVQTVVLNKASDRLVNGEALNKVARELRAATDKTSTGKAKRTSTRRTAKATVTTPEQALTALHAWLDCGLKDIEAAKGIAANTSLAALIAKVGQISAVLATPAKAQRVKHGLKVSPGRGVKTAARKAA